MHQEVNTSITTNLVLILPEPSLDGQIVQTDAADSSGPAKYHQNSSMDMFHYRMHDHTQYGYQPNFCNQIYRKTSLVPTDDLG